MQSEPAVSALSSTAAVAASQRSRAAVGLVDLAFAVIVVGAELALAALAVKGVPLALVLVGHLALIALGSGALALRRRSGGDLTAMLLMLIAVSASGPLGAVGSLLAIAWLMLPARPSPLLEEWYERISLSTTIDPVTRLAERVAAGRVIAPLSAPPASFSGVIGTGGLEQRQRALGLIARKFHHGYLPTLQAALRSEEPVIRVQAAAVAAHVGPGLAAETVRLIEAADHADRTDLAGAVGIASKLEALAASGLIDKPMEDRARAAVDRLIGSIDVLAIPRAMVREREGREPLDTLERMLLARRHVPHLRVLRLMRRHAADGLWRVRRRERRGQFASAPAGLARG